MAGPVRIYALFDLNPLCLELESNNRCHICIKFRHLKPTSMDSTLIVPIEAPPTLRDIKRALLCFEKVLLVDPSDRDLIPPNLFWPAVAGLPVLAIDTGPVRPMIKTIDYDDKFQQLMDSLSVAKQAGLVEVITTFRVSDPNEPISWGYDSRGYPLDPGLVLDLYRIVASDKDLLRSSLDFTSTSIVEELDKYGAVLIDGAADISINDTPALPHLEADSLTDDELRVLTSVARSRIGAAIKYMGYCESKELVPTYHNDGYFRIISSLTKNACELLVRQFDDKFWSSRNRVLDIAFETLFDPGKLDEITLSDVIKLRSTQWGKFQEARKELLEGAFEISKEGSASANFDAYVKSRLVEIRKVASELETQRRSLDCRVFCEVSAAILAGGMAVVPKLQSMDFSREVSLPITCTALLVFGAAYLLARAPTIGDAELKLENQMREARRGAGFAMSKMLTTLRDTKLRN